MKTSRLFDRRNKMLREPRPTFLLIADAFHPRQVPPEAGTNTFVAGALASRGWDVTVWAGAGSTEPPDSPGVRVTGNVTYWGMAEILRIMLWMLLRRPLRIGIAYFSDMYSSRGYIALIPLAARMLGLSCVTHFTNDQRPKGGDAAHRRLAWLGLRRPASPVGLFGHSQSLLFYSSLDRSRLLESAGAELWDRSAICSPPTILPDPGRFDASRCRGELGAGNGEFLIGYFGLFYPGKSVETLIRAAKILLDRGVSVKLALIGACEVPTVSTGIRTQQRKYLAFLQELILETGTGDRVRWTGYLAPLQASRNLSSCDLVCLPFKAGLTLTRSSFVECASLGVPVVTTRSEFTDTALLAEGTGITFVSPRDPVQLAEAILELKNDPRERARRGRLSKRFAESLCGGRALVDSFDGRESRPVYDSPAADIDPEAK